MCDHFFAGPTFCLRTIFFRDQNLFEDQNILCSFAPEPGLKYASFDYYKPSITDDIKFDLLTWVALWGSLMYRQPASYSLYWNSTKANTPNIQCVTSTLDLFHSNGEALMLFVWIGSAPMTSNFHFFMKMCKILLILALSLMCYYTLWNIYIKVFHVRKLDFDELLWQ